MAAEFWKWRWSASFQTMLDKNNMAALSASKLTTGGAI